jgi:hypothetical protein
LLAPNAKGASAKNTAVNTAVNTNVVRDKLIATPVI